MGYKLVTSNEDKLREFKRFGLELEMEKGADLQEVLADPVTVVLYKAKEAGKGKIVEDTSLDIEGADIGVMVKFLKENIDEFIGAKALWRVLLGVNDGEYVSVYEGLVEGTITNRFREPRGFGFDCLVIPNGQDNTLYELDLMGKKDEHSARKKAVESFLNETPIQKVALSEIKKWIGDYQN